MSHTLIVYESRPEEVELYLVPNEIITARMRELLSLAHGTMMNGDEENDGQHFLNMALLDPDYKSDDENELFHEFSSIFHPYKQEYGAEISLDDVRITNIYQSGFNL